MDMKKNILILLTFFSFFITACAPVVPFKKSNQHIKQTPKPAGKPLEIMQTAPLPAAPSLSASTSVYTVVVNDVPVKELLFAIARDANVEVDINGSIAGKVTLNAIDQTFDEIIDRISRQTNIRYRVKNNIYLVEIDAPYLKHYDVSYVNMERVSESTIAIATEVSSTGGTGGDSTAGNISSTSITNNSSHRFWATLTNNINNMLSESSQENEGEADESASGVIGANIQSALAGVTGEESGEADEEGSEEGDSVRINASRVISSPESSMISVMATQQQHRMVQEYLDLTLEGVQRQVFIEATIVEVELNDDYQAGVDWSRLVQAGSDGFSFTQALTGKNLIDEPVSTLQYTKAGGKYNLNATVKLLNQFGNTTVLSSPKLMVLNNQTALLKVVDNRVYFTIDVETDIAENGLVTRTFESKVHTVPVGLVMSVTPQVSPEEEITLNVRPTISRILRFVRDPNPALGDVENLIPEISVREIESILRVKNGDVAVIGGLMQDNRSKSTDGVPHLSKVSGIGDLFSYRDDKISKSELVIFLKPIVAQRPTLNDDFSSYKRFLNTPSAEKVEAK